MRLPDPRLLGLRGVAMELFTKLFGDLLVFVYHCFDRMVIHGYLSGLSRPDEQVVHFCRNVVGAPVVEAREDVGAGVHGSTPSPRTPPQGFAVMLRASQAEDSATRADVGLAAGPRIGWPSVPATSAA
jgi:hypothetical protein